MTILPPDTLPCSIVDMIHIETIAGSLFFEAIVEMTNVSDGYVRTAQTPKYRSRRTFQDTGM